MTLIKRFDNLFRVFDQADFGMPADLATAIEKLPRYELPSPWASSARPSQVVNGAEDEGTLANDVTLLFNRWSRCCDMPFGAPA
jgi:hypothetical protein